MKSAHKYKYTPKNKLPKIAKIVHAWDLKSLYYKSESDPKIERDVKKAELLYSKFNKKYAGKNFTSTSIKLKKSLDDYKSVISHAELSKPLYYFYYRAALNANDATAQKNINLIEERLTKASNQILFFELNIGKITVSKQKKYLNDSTLKEYHYYLKTIFNSAKHLLSEPEEHIMSLKSRTSYGMWTEATEKTISKRNISFKGRAIPIPEALEILDTLSSKKKRELWKALTDELFKISEFAEHEFNAIVTNKKIDDYLRGYKHPYSATILGYENNEKSVEAMVKAVSNKGFKLSRDFYTLKARFHKHKKLPYVNKYDPISKDIAISFKEAVEICRDVFYETKTEYGKIFDHMLKNGHIDVYPKNGKRGGAFMSGALKQPTMVFLNHTNNFKSLETLAHEMGHAIHTERSKKQTAIYAGYSTTVAETASTFFEQLVFNRIYEMSSESRQKVLLHDRILRDISTIQRQIAFYNFELDLHTTIRRNGAMTRNEMSLMMQKHLNAYLGPSVSVTKEDGYSFVYIPHFRYGFYVYSYAYGILASNVMVQKLKDNPSYIKKIDGFLSSGGSDTVENLFASIDIDTKGTATFNRSLDTLAKDINKFKAAVS